jgi:hypothetical protein
METKPQTDSDRAYLSYDECGLRVTPADDFYKLLINKRRTDVVRPWPFMSLDAAYALTDEVYATFGLNDYIGCSTFEYYMRQAPHTMMLSELEALDPIIEETLPYVGPFVIGNAEVTSMAYTERSSLGWDDFCIPFSLGKTKLEMMRPRNAEFIKNPDVDLSGAFVRINVRLQPERPDKQREYIYVTSDGRVFRQTLKDRYDAKVGRIASRTRLVFAYPWPNLVTQIADNAFHTGMLRYSMFHHDVSSLARRHFVPSTPPVAIDFRHFERYTCYMCEKWAHYVGGNYGSLLLKMLHLPFLVATVGKGKEHFAPAFITCDHPKWRVQLGSGISTVSVIQKIFMACVYLYFFMRRRNKPPEEVLLELVSQSGPTQIWNYGDDNVVFSTDANELYDLGVYLASILPVELEDPPMFLGMQFGDPPVGLHLPTSSYLKNWFQAERQPGSLFRPFYEHGWRARNVLYSSIGHPEIPRYVIPKLEEILPRYGVTQEVRDQRFLTEKLLMAQRGAAREYANEKVVMDKLTF